VGCDFNRGVFNPDGWISIHAPAWGATLIVTSKKTHFEYFNPRTRVGCDCLLVINISYLSISIHAPAWGATAKVYKIICKKK
jgi:hypothetical protein